jgi:hypothetical protein
LKWRQRFVGLGIEGILADAPRPGRKKSISPEKEAAIVEATLKNQAPECHTLEHTPDGGHAEGE